MIELNTSFLMRVLTVADMLALYCQPCDEWMHALTGSYIGGGSNIGCKIWSYFRDIIASYASWVLCVITIERVIALALPLRATSICTKKNSMIVLSLTLVVISAILISGCFSSYSCVWFIFNESNYALALCRHSPSYPHLTFFPTSY